MTKPFAAFYQPAIGALCGIIVALGCTPRSAATDTPPLYGFAPASSETELKLEEEFRSLPDTGNLRSYLERLSAHPHHVGSPYDKANAEWIMAQMKSWGWDSTIETFDVLFPTPKTRLVEMTEPVYFKAKLQEEAFAVDPTSGQTAEQLPTYNAYSIDGDVTGRLVYVNFGVPEDYDELDRLGISVKGAIVIAKYGKAWRGIKPKVAAEHGAIGCLLYSDPGVDGYTVGDTFPNGPMRNTNGVQRGSVMDFPTTGSGDPLTPGYGAVPGAKRIAIKDAAALTKIPVQPLSSGDAQALLAQLKGPVAPPLWRGNLPLTYHLGPGPATVHLQVAFNWDTKPIYDVISRLRGGAAGDECVIRGNHFDAWVNGASDPLSGQICLLEEARSLGVLSRQGWKPRRTIIYCSWDGEEPGLLGSTEWVETHAEELRRSAVAYVNSDETSRGYFSMDGSPILQKLINDSARDIADPETKLTIWKRAQDLRIYQATEAAKRRELRQQPDLIIGPLGSGSDYGSFLDFAGVPCLSLEFSGESSDAGVYHSIYDDFYWFTHFGDTNFVYGQALAQATGTAVLRLADAEVVPYEFGDFAETLQRYTKELQELLRRRQEEIKEHNTERAEGVYAAVSDPRNPLRPPKTEAEPPDLDFSPLQAAVKALAASAKRYQEAAAAAQPGYANPDNARAEADLNQLLLEAEHRLTDPKGLPGRPWFKHLLYAPGTYSGYDAKTMPGIREGIELGHYDQATREITRVSKAIESETTLLDSATQILEKFRS